MFESDLIASSGLPDCPDETKGGRDERGLVPLRPIHVESNVLISGHRRRGLAGANERRFQALSAKSKLLVVFVPDKVGLSDVLASLGSIYAEQEGVVLDQTIKGIL